MRRIPSLVKEENSMFYLFTTRKESLQDEKITCSINAVSLSAALLGPGKATVSTIVKDWTDSFFEKSDDTNALMNSESTLHRIGNTIGHSTKIPEAQVVYVDERDSVRSKRSQLEKVTATDIFNFM